MKHQTSAAGSTSRRNARRLFALAVAVGLVSSPGWLLAEDGIRELRSPSDMHKIAPVRAVGIRLSPATPLDFNQAKPSNSKSSTQETASTPIPTTPIPTTPIPTTPIPTSPIPTSPIPTSPSLVSASETAGTPAKSPQRFIPKSKVSETTSDKDATRTPLIKVQTPVQISSGPSDGIRTVSAPSPSKQPTVSGLVATESQVLANEKSTLDSSSLPTPERPGPQLPSDVSTVSSITNSEMDKASCVNVDVQSTQEITIDFPVRSVLVHDENVCRAMSSGSYLYIVGLSSGESIIEVKPTDDRPSRYLRVKVAAPWQRSGDVKDLDQLVHTIQPLNPKGVLTVRALDDGSIVVQGKVDNKEVAKRIMELTRKLILVPVVDKLEIR